MELWFATPVMTPRLPFISSPLGIWYSSATGSAPHIRSGFWTIGRKVSPRNAGRQHGLGIAAQRPHPLGPAVDGVVVVVEDAGTAAPAAAHVRVRLVRRPRK